MTIAAVDVGGTFRDVVVATPDGRRVTGKYLTTPDDIADAVVRGLDDCLRRAGQAPGDLTRLVHATTLATNTILERRGVPVAFVTTRGFRELLTLGRQAVVETDRYDLMAESAEVPVPLSHCFEISERLGPGGEVLVPFDHDQAREQAARIAALDVQAVAVCFLHAYGDPTHEQRMSRLLAEAFGDRPVVIVASHEVWPEVREYERATTTLLSAYVGPVMRGYLRTLRDRLAAHGVNAPLHIMDSSGGVMSAQRAADVAIRTLESGPAAGVVAARQVGTEAGIVDLLAFDMGGTTAKAGIVRGGRIAVTRDFQAGGKGSFGGRRAGTGLPVKIPAVDLAEVGSGGGSIAWVDAAGSLHVGPRSAGADPGPACYGLGGAEPTVTDADLLLGFLDPEAFAGGTVPLHPDLAGKAVDELAGRLGSDRLSTAHAIVQLADAGMGFAVQVVTVQRGIDPRRFTLVASGGAGPTHAARIAERFGITTVLVPAGSGVGSAVGLLDCDLGTEAARTLARPLLADAPEALAGLDPIFDELAAATRGELGVAADGPALLTREVDLRYRGQAFALTVPLPVGRPDLEQLLAAFRAAYTEAYGSHPDGPIELVTVRVRAVVPVTRPRRAPMVGSGRSTRRTRPVSFAPGTGYVPTPVVRRGDLQVGETLTGPAIVEDDGSTTVVPPGWTAALQPFGALELTRS